MWRSVATMPGAQCVIMGGEKLMPEWFVDNWISLLQVYTLVMYVVFSYIMTIQIQLPPSMPCLARELVP